MQSFFHKYQRLLFIFITVLTVSSFIFFGVLDTIVNRPVEKEDVQITKCLDGSKMMLSKVQKLSRFLSSESQDYSINPKGSVNLCNNGVISGDFLSTRIADHFVELYIDDLKADLGTRLDRVKRFKGYERWDAPYVNAKAVWDQFKPEISQAMHALKSQQDVSVETFTGLKDLYLLQKSCPPELVKLGINILTKQCSWLQPDSRLDFADLSMFGFHSVGEWFGSDFLDFSAQVILNGAAVAKQKGFSVTVDEAKADLVMNFNQALEKYPNLARSVESLATHLRGLGFEEREACEIWADVLLFRKYFQSIGDVAFVDALPYKDFAAFTREVFEIEKYEWPKSLQFKSFNDMVDFQVYIHALGADLQSLQLPQKILSVQKVQEKFPLLVSTDYNLEFRKVDLSDLAMIATLKDVLSWQMEASNWDHLVAQFPFLQKVDSESERFASLESLSFEQRKKVDEFARMSWAKLHMSSVEAMLELVPTKSEEISVSKDWVSLPDIKDPKSFHAFLQIYLEEGSSNLKPSIYSDGADSFYQIVKVEKLQDPHILTFEKACKLGVMSTVCDSFMQQQYEKLRLKHAAKFQAGEGQWKLFSSVKDDVARLVFKDLLKAIGENEETLAYYASHRLEMPSKDACEKLKHKQGEGLLSDVSEDPIVQQFKLLKTNQQIQRTTKEGWMKDQIFIMTPKQWSPVYVPADGNISFFYFEKSNEYKEPILSQISFGKEIIASDAKCFVARNMLERIKQQNSIVSLKLFKENP